MTKSPKEAQAYHDHQLRPVKTSEALSSITHPYGLAKILGSAVSNPENSISRIGPMIGKGVAMINSNVRSTQIR